MPHSTALRYSGAQAVVHVTLEKSVGPQLCHQVLWRSNRAHRVLLGPVGCVRAVRGRDGMPRAPPDIGASDKNSRPAIRRRDLVRPTVDSDAEILADTARLVQSARGGRHFHPTDTTLVPSWGLPGTW